MEDVKFTDISLSKGSDAFIAAVDTEGGVYSWGSNSFG
jgi:alpha-tubulin suppressor-like RCC1 family protein